MSVSRSVTYFLLIASGDMQTGRLLDILEGHEGPVSSLAFNPMNGELASASWDHTVMIWDVFSGNKVCNQLHEIANLFQNHKDMFSHGTDVLCVAYRPDGKQLASSSMDGRINLWDPINGLQMGTIEGRNDVFTKKKSSKVGCTDLDSLIGSRKSSSDPLAILLTESVCWQEVTPDT